MRFPFERFSGRLSCPRKRTPAAIEAVNSTFGIWVAGLGNSYKEVVEIQGLKPPFSWDGISMYVQQLIRAFQNPVGDPGIPSNSSQFANKPLQNNNVRRGRVHIVCLHHRRNEPIGES